MKVNEMELPRHIKGMFRAIWNTVFPPKRKYYGKHVSFNGTDHIEFDVYGRRKHYVKCPQWMR